LGAAFRQLSRRFIGYRLAGVFNKPQQVVSNRTVVTIYSRKLEFTGAPSKNFLSYRGAQQEIPGRPARSRSVYDTHVKRMSCKTRRNVSLIHDSAPLFPSYLDYRGVQQEIPGRPAKIAGAPSKTYRGARRGMPGCPAKHTGAPDEECRGAQQELQTNFLQKRVILTDDPPCCSVMFIVLLLFM
jgi:hypothetical protein